jgi:hypothetical protein
LRWNIPSAGLVLFLFERSGRMGKVLIWFVIIISTVVLYCLMKVKAESDELYEELMRKHFYGRSDDIPASDQTKHLKGCG